MTDPNATTPRFIGKSTPLIEGKPKVLGALRFCADLERPGMLHARLVTSPHAHATLLDVDTSAAREVPGVVAVITAEDLPQIPPSGRAVLMLARDRVLFTGHPVALVLGESEAAAQDGAEAVFADYEVLPAAVSMDAALAEDGPAIWPEGLPGASDEAAAHGATGGGASDAVESSPNVASRTQFTSGDLEAAWASSDAVVERTFDTAGVHQAYLEPHVSLVEYDSITEGFNIWSSTQATFGMRDAVAKIAGVEATRVRVVGTPVGGGFGGKFLLYEPMLALVSKAVGRPILHAMTRIEEMLAANPAPSTRAKVKLGMKADGSLTGLQVELLMDNGIFPSSLGVLAAVLFSVYKTEAHHIEGVEILTNKPSVGAYRAPCAPQCAFAYESLIDELAGELGLDPLTVRRHNAAEEGTMMAVGAPWPRIGMQEALDALAQHPAWTNREEARRQGRGVGIAVGGWPGGTEPAAAACDLQTDGTLSVHVGHADISGTNTSLALVAAESFGIEPEKVRIVGGDTSNVPYAGASGGSKTMYTVGPAVIEAAEAARAQAFELAAAKFEADPQDLEIQNGAVQVKGSPDKAIPLAKLAQSTMRYGSKQAPVFAQGRHAQMGPSPGFSAQLAEVSVDEDTGAVKLHRLVVVQDVGRALNPAAVEGQMTGGAVQGIGWALYEQLAYDDQGQLLTATFNDYAIPHITQSPEIDLVRVEVPSPTGPFGAKGVGEPPVIPTAAAIGNAIADACGARMETLPMTAPRVLETLSSH